MFASKHQGLEVGILIQEQERLINEEANHLFDLKSTNQLHNCDHYFESHVNMSWFNMAMLSLCAIMSTLFC